MKMMNIATLCALLAVPALGCSKKVTRQDHETDKAAETAVKDQRDLAKDVRDNKSASDVRDDMKDLDKSNADFAAKKDLRVQILRSVHALDVAQLAMLRGMPQTLAYTAAGEADINSKLTDATTALDNAGRMIEALPSATADEWNAKDDEVSAAMTRLNVAIQDAQTTVRDAPRQTPTTSS